MAVVACPNCKTGSEAPDDFIGTKAVCFSCGSSGMVYPDNEVPEPEELLRQMESLTRQSVGTEAQSSPLARGSSLEKPKRQDPFVWLLSRDGGSQAAIVVLLFAMLLAQLAGFAKTCLLYTSPSPRDS